ncbi:MAG: calcium-translocating P-type ATPase, SERCA-type [Sphingomonadaceae bacterium]
MEKEYHSLDLVEAAGQLRTDLAKGLSAEEARARLEKYGPNELQERKGPSFLQMVLAQLTDFLVIILIVASVISMVLGEFIDAGVIMAIVVLNAIIGVVQESKAEKSLAALKKMAAPMAKVIRDGHVLDVPSRELVPGDLVLLETGNYVPADVRLIESVNLKIEEASLTGESVPVEKDCNALLKPDAPIGDRKNSGFMSTTVTYGRGKGIVVGTGMQTQIGKIAQMIQEVEAEATPLQKKLEELGKSLGIACLAICAVVFALGVWEGNELLEMFMVAVSLAIAAVPEGLPAIVTICLALGMQRMVARHALIRRLPAVETLGSVTVICSDKTGTLTQNEMTVVKMFVDGQMVDVSGKGYTPVGEFLQKGTKLSPKDNAVVSTLLRGAALCNDAVLERSTEREDAWRMVGDPTEGALVVAAAKAGFQKEEMEKAAPRVAEVPFDSDRKCMTTFHKDGGATGFTAFVKGAPDVMLSQCTKMLLDGQVVPLDEAKRQQVLDANHSMAAQALRVLAIAYRDFDEVPAKPTPETVERELTLVGLMGMIDPARPEVKDAVHTCKSAGIKAVMITGDHKDTAVAIADELDMIGPKRGVLTGADLDKISDEEFANIVEDVNVYARVSPAHKVKIVEALRAKGHVAAMTGDGVNDAPALKRADIGVAMGITGTDVAKETADMVLTDDNFASIVSAVEEGRIIYSNIRKFVFFLLSCNVGEILTVFIAMLIGMPVPLRPIQLLWLNLLTDGLPALALGMEKAEPGIMNRPPRPKTEAILNREMQIGIAVQGVAIMVATLGAFSIGLQRNSSYEEAQTMAFATLVFSELLRAYTARSEYYSIFTLGIFSNKYMVGATILSSLLILLPLYLTFLHPIFDVVTPDAQDWTVILLFALIPSTAAEITKIFLRRFSTSFRQKSVEAN